MIRIAALLLTVLSFPAALGCGAARAEKQDFWHLDLAEGTRVALETGRPMLVVFR